MTSLPPSSPTTTPSTRSPERSGGSAAVLAWARWAVTRHGAVVFPVAHKTPARAGWRDHGSRDPDQLTRWFADGGHNYGIDTGHSDLLVVDLDVARGCPAPPQWAGARSGADVLARLAEQHAQPYPHDTLTVATPSGGLHLYFRQPPGLQLRNTQGESGQGLGWCVDTRGHGGFVVGPGSVGRGGARYRLLRHAPIASLPPWLAELLTPPPPPPPRPALTITGSDAAARYVAATLRSVCADVRAAAIGSRHNALLKAALVCGNLVGGGLLSEQTARAALDEAAATHVGVAGCTHREVRRTIDDGLAYGQRRPRTISPASRR